MSHCHHCGNCNGNCNCHQNSSPCTPIPTPCNGCAIKDFPTDCIIFVGEDLACSGIVKNTPLTEVITQLDAHICTAVSQMNNPTNLINVGTGSEIYAGIDGLGKRKIRSLISDNPIITLAQNTDDLTFDINEAVLDQFIEDNQLTYSADNVGSGAFVFKDSTVVGDNTQFNIKSITSSDGSVIVTDGLNEIDLTVDGSETKILAGNNTVVLGTGTTGDPYTIDSILPYDLYLVTLTQTSTSAPVVTTNLNTGSLTVSPSRVGVGIYRLSAIGTPFQVGFTHILHNNGRLSSPTDVMEVARISDSELEIRTYNTTTLTDGILTNAYIEVKII